MRRPRRASALIGIAVVATVAATAAPALAHGNRHGSHWKKPKGDAEAVKVVATGLNGPFGIATEHGKIWVAESFANLVTEIDIRTGQKRVVEDRLVGPAGVDRVGNRLAIATGGAEVPDASITGDSTVFQTRKRSWKEPEVIADLEAYELANNPDGQLQFDPETGEPLDALSNPFALLAHRGRAFVFVADAGANVVLKVSESGKVSTFFVPPVINTGACEGRPNNDPEHTGCDPVPTGLAYGPGNTLYVSTLTAEAPGEGRVYVLNARTGKVKKVISGFNSPTGIAVGSHGEFYVSELLYGAPEGEGPPPDDFDPSTVGRIVRVDRWGNRTYAQVTMPTGLTIDRKGNLYAAAWAIAPFFGMMDAGQIVRVSSKAFGPEGTPMPTTTAAPTTTEATTTTTEATTTTEESTTTTMVEI